NLLRLLAMAAAFLALFSVCFMLQKRSRWRTATVVITIVMFGFVFDSAFAGPRYENLFSHSARQTEQEVYRVAEQFIAAVPKMRDLPGGVRFWYNNRPGNLISSVQSTYLWAYSRFNVASSDDPGMPYIGPYQLGLFNDKSLKYLVLIGETKAENEV